MNLNFSEVLADLGPNAGFVIANEARPPSEYMLNAILPEEAILDYNIADSNITVRSMMAGMVGMDSPYPPTGFVEGAGFLENTIKVANAASIPEEVMRQLQALVRALGAGSATTERIQQEVLNFYAKVIVQPHFDTAEWLRAQALMTGALAWTFNGITLAVDYNMPAANLLTARSGNDAYNGSSSKFWTDVIAAKALLKQNLQVAIAHSTTIDAIVSNSTVNQLYVIGEGAGYVDVQQWMTTGSNNPLVPHPDSRYQLRLYAYDLEGEVYDGTDYSATTKIPFITPGKILYIGKNDYDRVYRVGMGSTDSPDSNLRLGFTAIAPTVEGGGTPGRWGRLLVKENTPWQLEGEAVTNLLPVLRAPEKVVVATTTLT